MNGSTERLTIVYDERCTLCRRARDWLLTQPCLVPVELLAAGSAEARRRYRSVEALGSELVAVDDKGNVWVGPAAFLASMWATARYRAWAFRLARPHLAPHAERFFRWVSVKRSRWSSDDPDCAWCDGGRTRCLNGHEMSDRWNYCETCGAGRA